MGAPHGGQGQLQLNQDKGIAKSLKISVQINVKLIIKNYAFSDYKLSQKKKKKKFRGTDVLGCFKHAQLDANLWHNLSLNSVLNFKISNSKFGNFVKLRSKLRQLQVGPLK